MLQRLIKVAAAVSLAFTTVNSVETDAALWVNYTNPVINIGGIYPFVLAHTMGATNLALKQINDNGSIVHGYTVVPLYRDSGANTADSRPSVAAAVQLLNLDGSRGNASSVQLILGPDAPVWVESCITLASAVKNNVPFLNFAVSSPDLSNRVLYPNFARIITSDSAQGTALAALVQYFGWSTVAALGSANDVGQPIIQAFQAAAQPLGINLLMTQTYNTGATFDISLQIAALKSSGARVILMAFSNTDVISVAHQLYAANMYGPPYVFLGVNTWFRQAAPLQDPIVQIVFNGTVGTAAQAVDPVKMAAFTTQWQQLYAQNPNWTHNIAAPVLASAGVYDSAMFGVTALGALVSLKTTCATSATNNTAQCTQLAAVGPSQMLYSLMLNTSYAGITGVLALNSVGDIALPFNIVNYLGNPSPKVLGVLSTKNAVSMLDGTLSGGAIWAGSSTAIPKDHVIVLPQLVTISDGTFAGVTAAACVGMMFALAVMIWMVVKWEVPMIKMSSPRVNTVIIFGCVLGYVLVIIVALIDSDLVPVSSFTGLCHAELWIATMSFTFAFGALLVKTLRVHRIFNNPKLRSLGSSVTDTYLFAQLGGLLLIDVVLCAAWSGSDPFYRQVNLGIISTTDQADYNTQPVTTQCQSQHYNAWIAAIYAYKGLQLLAGVVLAVKVRSVQIPALNDSKWIGFCIYNITILLAMLLPVSTIVASQVQAAVALRAAVIILMSTTTLALLFGPKIVLISTGKDAQYAQAKMTSGLMSGTGEKQASGFNNVRSSVTNPQQSMTGNNHRLSSTARGSTATAKSLDKMAKSDVYVPAVSSDSSDTVVKDTPQAASNGEFTGVQPSSPT